MNKESNNITDKGDPGKRVYISGAVTGLPYEEAERVFAEAESKLLAEGYDAVNPVKFGLNDGWEWQDYMTRDLEILKSCEAIYLLDGWEQSHGARTEYEFARGMGLEVMHQDEEQ
ncbi:MAG: DUF4406 domain-containing protein [Bacteroidales bacterium]|nr:DUF4406 domain-containing protein [Bacteroidales bacterium]